MPSIGCVTKLELNDRRIPRRFLNICTVSNTLPNNLWDKREVKMKIQKNILSYMKMKKIVRDHKAVFKRKIYSSKCV